MGVNLTDYVQPLCLFCVVVFSFKVLFSLVVVFLKLFLDCSIANKITSEMKSSHL